MKFGADDTAVEVNIPTRDALFRILRERLSAREGFALATLNLEHLTKLRVDPAFLAAYRAHDMVVADGRPIVWLSRIARRPVKLLPGSDLIMPLCALCVELGIPVALIGSSDDALAGAAAILKSHNPGLEVDYCHAPSLGFDPHSAESENILAELAVSRAGLCFVALGAPKQEVFASVGRQRVAHIGFASIGAGLDFFSGHQVRAPKVMRTLALEWLWRTAQSPRRMVPRYARCFAILPGLVARAVYFRGR